MLNGRLAPNSNVVNILEGGLSRKIVNRRLNVIGTIKYVAGVGGQGKRHSHPRNPILTTHLEIFSLLNDLLLVIPSEG